MQTKPNSRLVSNIDTKAPIEGLAWSSDGSTIAISGGLGRKVGIWTTNGSLLRNLQTSVTFAGNSIAFLGTNRLLTSADRNSNAGIVPAMTLWNIENGTILFEVPGPDQGSPDRLNHASIFAVSPDKKRVAAIFSPVSNMPLSIYNAEDWSVEASFSFHKEIPTSVAFRDSDDLLVGTVKGEVLLVNIAKRTIATERLKVYPEGFNISIDSMSLSSDGKVLATGGGLPLDGYRSKAFVEPIKLWDADTFQNLSSYSGAYWPVRSLSWSKQGRRLAATGGDRRAYLFQTNDETRESFLYNELLADVKFSPDGSFLAVAHGSVLSIYANE